MSLLASHYALQTLMTTGVLASQGFDSLLQCGLGIPEPVEAPAETEPHLSREPHLRGPVTQQFLKLMRGRYQTIGNQLRDEQQIAGDPQGSPTAYDALRARLDTLRPREEQPLIVQLAMIPSELYAALAVISLQTMLGELIVGRLEEQRASRSTPDVLQQAHILADRYCSHIQYGDMDGALGSQQKILQLAQAQTNPAISRNILLVAAERLEDMPETKQTAAQLTQLAESHEPAIMPAKVDPPAEPEETGEKVSIDWTLNIHRAIRGIKAGEENTTNALEVLLTSLNQSAMSVADKIKLLDYALDEVETLDAYRQSHLLAVLVYLYSELGDVSTANQALRQIHNVAREYHSDTTEQFGVPLVALQVLANPATAEYAEDVVKRLVSIVHTMPETERSFGLLGHASYVGRLIPLANLNYLAARKRIDVAVALINEGTVHSLVDVIETAEPLLANRRHSLVQYASTGALEIQDEAIRQRELAALEALDEVIREKG